eukprot:TRINITY_DN3177_c0_g1_i1.p1 TRINITY_DN3177_c0_g1~~TRINITY_DN3177_c0_g1_i1.p1  ORF type:complete len:1112 (-),score=358.83 TRINITY_DN3177_c0_g1_i1:119-3454(-)
MDDNASINSIESDSDYSINSPKSDQEKKKSSPKSNQRSDSSNQNKDQKKSDKKKDETKDRKDGESEPEKGETRQIQVGRPSGSSTNFVVTSKYTIFTFLPKNLYEQFRRVSNLYFLMISLIGIIPGVSPVSPVTTIAPLLFVLAVTAAKEGWEDWLRHLNDRKVNARKVEVFDNGKFVEKQWSDLRIGDVIKVEEDREFAADIFLINSSEEDGVAYTETSNLDGETSLKNRLTLDDNQNIKSESQLQDWISKKVVIDSEGPGTDVNKYNGKLTVGSETYALTMKNMLLRGCTLKNVDWIYGAVVFVGDDTRLRRNAQTPDFKMSSFEKKINELFYFLFALYFFIIVASVTYGLLMGRLPWYITDQEVGIKDVLLRVGTFIILFSGIIPISLFVSLDLTKLFLSYFIGWDDKMYDKKNQAAASAKNFSLIEELGRINYIMTDKTGTLTMNDMKFAKCAAGGKIFDSNFESEELDEFWTLITVCQDIMPEMDKKGKLKYRATSEDERALVEAAKENNFVFNKRDKTKINVKVRDEDRTFEILQILEFNSDRKRMSVVARDGSGKGKLRLYTKGADSIMLKLLNIDASEKRTCQNHLDKFAEEGFRTLCLGSRELKEDEYNSWKEKYEEAGKEIEDRESKMDKVAEELEKDLKLVGVTAIEDKLQDKVPEVLETLSRAGIKIWVLTGDKLETAMNIGRSCRLLTEDTRLFILQECEDIESELKRIETEMDSDKNGIFGIVVDGKSLEKALEDHDRQLYDVCHRCKSVVVARISPLQKAEMVKLVRRFKPKTRILSVGDGANDVSMIQEADVGVGIIGIEGKQAVMSSDYAIGQFKYLRRLILVHGHWGYERLSLLVLYSFYKNAAFILIQFWFVFYSYGSGQTVYESWSLSMFNVLFTFLPIIVCGILEQDVGAERLMAYPKLYNVGQKNADFNMQVFLYWIMDALYQSLVIFYGVLFIFENDILHYSGKVLGLWGFGVTLYTVALTTVTVKLFFEIRYVTAVHMLAFGLSLANWFFWVVGFYAIPENSVLDNSNQLLGIANDLFVCPAFWFSLVLLPFASLMPTIVVHYLSRMLRPQPHHVINELEALHNRDPDMHPLINEENLTIIERHVFR